MNILISFDISSLLHTAEIFSQFVASILTFLLTADKQLLNVRILVYQLNILGFNSCLCSHIYLKTLSILKVYKDILLKFQ